MLRLSRAKVLVDTADMEGVTVERILFLDGADFAGKVHLRGARIGDQIFAANATTQKSLNLDGADIRGGVALNGVKTPELILRGASIGDSLTILGQASIAKISASTMEVKRTIIIGGESPAKPVCIGELQRRGLSTGYIDISNAVCEILVIDNGHIAGNLDVTDSTFQRLSSPFLRVNGMIRLNGSSFDRVDLDSCEISQLHAKKVLVRRNLNLLHALVDDAVMLEADVVVDEMDMSAIRAGVVNLAGGKFRSVTLNGGQIGKYLSLGGTTAAAKWAKEGRLSLVNTHVGAIEDSENAWPPDLSLEGFVYDRWGAFEPATLPGGKGGKPGERSSFRNRSDAWYRRWLDSQPSTSSQPYLQLASIFRAAGLDERASDMLYAGKERERRQAPLAKKVVLMMSKVLTGYGHQYELSVLWSVGFIIVGWVCLRFSRQSRSHGYRLGLAYSVDMFLPIIQLRRRHYDIDLEPPLRYYFYVHRLAGFVIGTFVVAAVAGFR